MKIATKANSRTTQAAQTSLDKALRIAIFSGAVMGLSVVALGLFGLATVYAIFKDIHVIFGFSFGAASIALFARVGGGIYTKAADVGADLVGKVEKNIPEDDPRNPAVIADNVGDNVGDVAGMGADLFDSYIVNLVAAMALGFTLFNVKGVLFPMQLAAAGIVASLLGIFFVRTKDKENPGKALRNGVLATNVFLIVFSFFLSRWIFNDLSMFYAATVGVLAGFFIGVITERYTSYSTKHVQHIAKSSEMGAATNIIAGLSIGKRSTALSVIVLSVVIYLAYLAGGIYGVAIAGVGMLSVLGVVLAVDAYGPVVDNAGGIAEMAGLDKKVRERTDKLDAAGNTTAAIGKGFAIGSAALAALAIFSEYANAAGLSTIDILNHKVLIGLLIGAMIPTLFSSYNLAAVGKAAFKMIEEVRRQFREIKGIMERKAKPDYAKCVDISTSAALREMIMPGMIAIFSPLIVGFFIGTEALGGFLAGALVAGIVLAIKLSNSGGALDNAKKYIELGHHGGKGSEAHKAAIVGDTVGDPAKDVAGPSINILIKLMILLSVLFLPVF